MPGLKTGNYQVTASHPGFKKFVVDDVLLQSSQTRRVDIALEIGEVASEVTVSAAATAIQTETAKLGADFNAAKRYWDLPIPGNAFSGTYAVLAILPDVQREPGDWGAPRFAGQGGSQVDMGQDGIKEETSEQPDCEHGVRGRAEACLCEQHRRIFTGRLLRYDYQEWNQ